LTAENSNAVKLLMRDASEKLNRGRICHPEFISGSGLRNSEERFRK
jgi:hypothetical protein